MKTLFILIILFSINTFGAKRLVYNAANNLRVIDTTRPPKTLWYVCPDEITQDNVHLVDIVDDVAVVNQTRKTAWSQQKTQKRTDEREQLEKKEDRRSRLKASLWNFDILTRDQKDSVLKDLLREKLE